MNRLLEAYSKRLNVSDKVYASTHNGATLTESKKLVVATLLNNVNKRMNEAFSGSLATQQSSMGEWKKFCLALTTVAVPNLIAEDLVLVHPMTSIHGYIAYVKYSTGYDKGETAAGTVLRDVFRMKNVDSNYTGSAVVESVTLDAQGKATLAWFPIVSAALVDAESGATITITDKATGAITVTGETGTVKVKYVYDNVVIPQSKIPTLVANMDGMELHAKARRIGVMYSQMAAYEAKQDYGFDLPEQLSAQAVAELSYEIDNEIVTLLSENAVYSDELKFNTTLPVGISMRDHYLEFLQTVEKAKKIIYKKTQKCVPNYMVVSPEVKVILACIPDAFKAAGVDKMAGPYFAGTLGGLKVYVHPNMAEDSFFLGVNSSDMATSAAVFAPYMAIIPSSLLDFADGTTTQGWATMYDLKILNKDLLISGKIVAEPQVVSTKAVA